MRKFTRLSVLSLLAVVLSSLFVEARVMDTVTSKMRYIFFNLSGTQAFSVWLKFAMFVIIFAVLYNGGLKAMKAEGPMKRALAVIAFVVALTSAIFVPYKLLLYIFRLYSAVLTVLFAMLPALIGFMFNHTLFKGDSRMYRILRAVVYFLITIFIFGVIGTVDTLSAPEKVIYEQILEPLTYGAIIAFIAGIFNILMALGGDAVASNIWNRFSNTPTPSPTPTPTPAPTPTPVPPAPPNPVQVQELTNRMGQFINHVNNPPNGAVPLSHGLSTQFLGDIEAIIAPNPLPSPLSVPALHAAAGAHLGLVQTQAHDFMTHNLSPALGILGGIRTEMEGIYTFATTTGQYTHVAEGVRQQFEAAVTAFLVAETQLTELAGVIGVL